MDTTQVQNISLNDLEVSKFNVRKEIGDISELVSSIKSKGVLQPILVRPISGGKFEIIAGSRRFAAAKEAHLSSVPAVVRKMSDQEAIFESVSENVQRQNLSLEEVVRAYEMMEGTMTEAEFARGIDQSPTWFSKILFAQNTIRKFQEISGKNYTIAESPSPAEREKGIYPYTIVLEVGYALQADLVKEHYPKAGEINQKRVELIEAVKDLSYDDAKRFLERFKQFPEKSIQTLKEEIETRRSYIPIPKTAVPASVMRKVTEFAEKSGKTIDAIMPDIVNKGVEIETKRIEIENIIKSASPKVGEILRKNENFSPTVARRIIELPEDKQIRAIENIEKFRLNDEEALKHVDVIKTASTKEFEENMEVLQKGYEQYRAEVTQRLSSPDMQKRTNLFANLDGHKNIERSLEVASCPVCGKKELGWLCHDLDIHKATSIAQEKYDSSKSKVG